MTEQHRDEANAVEEAEEEQKAPVILVTHVHNLLHSIFFNVPVYINNQQIYNSISLHAQEFYFSNNLK